jgi:hypothetical protein
MDSWLSCDARPQKNGTHFKSHEDDDNGLAQETANSQSDVALQDKKSG